MVFIMANDGQGKKKMSMGGGVSSKQLTTFTIQLSTLQDAGLPIVRSLKILASQMKAGNLQTAITTVYDDVEGGSTFSEALSKHPKIFDRLYVNMVKAGEMGGVLDIILRRLAGFMEKAEKLKKKIKGAAVYPASVLTVAGGILTLIMILVVPQFQKIFSDMNVPLPMVTELLIAASNNMVNIWWMAPIGLGFIYGSFKLIAGNKKGKMILDTVVLKLPVFGEIVRKSNISRFTRTLGTLISSGVAILEALQIVKNATGNQVIANVVQKVSDSIREGGSVAEPLAQSGEFDDMVVNMIDVGEETGEMDKMLIKIADNFDEEVDVLVGAMVSLMEPALIVFMGGIIGFIVIALFLPLITLVQSMG